MQQDNISATFQPTIHTSMSATGLVTGNIYSQYIFGPVVGSVANDGTASLSVQNGADGSTWVIALTKTANGITINSIRNAASGQVSLGSGSCTKTVADSFDMSGQYPVRFQQTSPSGFSTIRSATMVLAKSSDSEYIGAILGDGGFKAKIRFFRTSGYWFAIIPAVGSEMGSYINSTNGLLTQSSPITDAELSAAMKDGVVTSSGMSGGIAPLRAEMYGSYKITVNGNVFADLELPDAEEMQAKAMLSIQIHDIIKRRHLTQAQAAELLGIDQPKVSALIRGRLKGFSMERLFHFLNLLGRDVQIVVKPKPRSRQQGCLRVAAA